MQADHARRLLGVDDRAGADDLRTAYRRALKRHHPDRSSAHDATERTIELTGAYRLLVELAATPPPRAAAHPPHGAPPHGAPPEGAPPEGAPPEGAPPEGAPSEGAPQAQHTERGPTGAPPPRSSPLELTIELVDDTTIALGAPPDETLFLVCETADQLGEITYLDPSAGLVEVIVEFVEAPTSSVVFTLQGRATGVTDVFVTVEPLSGGEAPPVDAVTRLVLDTVAAVAVAHDRRPITAPT